MELNEAVQSVRQLGNLFVGLKKIEDIITVAQQADNLAGERQKLIDARTAELAAVSQQIVDAKTAEAVRSQEAEKAHQLRLKEQEAQFDSTAVAFASVKARLDTDAADALKAHDEQTTKLLNEIRELTTTRDGLLSATADLQAQLAQLKDRAASL